ncbi:Myb/SANT-like domain-containing protein [Tanacetum coccineum]
MIKLNYKSRTYGFIEGEKRLETYSLKEREHVVFGNEGWSNDSSFMKKTLFKNAEIILFYNGLDVPTRQILDLKGSIPTKTIADAKVVIQEMAEYSQKWHNETSSKTRTIRHQGASIKTLEIQIGQMSKVYKKEELEVCPTQQNQTQKTMSNRSRLLKLIQLGYTEAHEVKILETYDHTLPQKEKDLGRFSLPCFIHNICFDKALVDLGESMSIMPFSTYTNLGLGILSHTRLTIELADKTIKQPRGIAKNVLVRIGKFIFPIHFIILDIPEDEDVLLILKRPFLSTAHSKIDVFKRKITIRVGEEKLVFKSVKPATSLIKRVFMLRNLDSKTELIREDVSESFDPLYGMENIGEYSKQKKPRLNWKKESVVKTFLEACIHEVAVNGRDGSSLKMLSWKNVLEILKKEHNFIVDQRQMKNHFDYLKSKFTAWTKLKNKSGNVYDPSNKYVEPVRSTGLLFPDLYTQLFDRSTSNGFKGWGPASNLPNDCEDSTNVVSLEDDDIQHVQAILTSTQEPPNSTQECSEEMILMLCMEKLENVGWGIHNPLYDVTVMLFSKSADYRKVWMRLKPESLENWVRNTGRNYGILD